MLAELIRVIILILVNIYTVKSIYGWLGFITYEQFLVRSNHLELIIISKNFQYVFLELKLFKFCVYIYRLEHMSTP